MSCPHEVGPESVLAYAGPYSEHTHTQNTDGVNKVVAERKPAFERILRHLFPGSHPLKCRACCHGGRNSRTSNSIHNNNNKNKNNNNNTSRKRRQQDVRGERGLSFGGFGLG